MGVKKKNLVYRVRYPQPHNIFIYTGNCALDDKLIERSHVQAKIKAKSNKSNDPYLVRFIRRYLHNPKYKKTGR